MTNSQNTDASRTAPESPTRVGPTEFKTPPPVQDADEVDEEILRLAQAVRALRDVLGPTLSVQELSDFVRWLVRESRELTGDQRLQAADYVRQGMGLQEALLLVVRMRPDAGSR
jgi:hypothetical protein